MKDFRNTELQINDKVCFCKCQSTRVANLFEGTIKYLCNISGYECATIEYNNDWGSTSEITLSSNKIVKI